MYVEYVCIANYSHICNYLSYVNPAYMILTVCAKTCILASSYLRFYQFQMLKNSPLMLFYYLITRGGATIHYRLVMFSPDHFY